MEKSNSLMRGFHPGVIAGFFGAISITVSLYLQTVLLGYEFIQDLSRIDVLINWFIFRLGYGGILGGILGIVYSKFYKKIPGKGIKKGLFFGCMIGLLSNIWIAFGEYLRWLLIGLDVYLEVAIANTQGILIWVTYGLVLGLMYEKWK